MKYKILLLTFTLYTSFTISANPISNTEKDQFRFFVNADPQMGPENTKRKGLKILNELLENFVDEVNQENTKDPIEFVLYNGDMVWDPFQDAFDNFTRIVSKQEVPTLLVHGNHDGYNDDPKFFQAQKKLSGFEKLNYSFDYGDWHFVVIGAQEKYLHKEEKDKQLAWLKNELDNNKDKQTMLFMHYHIMPVGLSQMEFYTYWPVEFKNQMLDTITAHGNVKYAFTGHVHTGVKASVKSSLEYKGTKFINTPTPVMARPFGEEYSEFEKDPSDRYFRRGFYLEVVVDGDDVKLIGHKIDHDFEVEYPEKLNAFKPANDPRFFKPESETRANKIIKNPSFNKGFKGWEKSYRYKKDKNNAFKNSVKNGRNILKLNSPWGSWTFDEYMETYQIVDLDLLKTNRLMYEFKKPKFSKHGAGGFIKVMFYSENKREEMLLLHWGHKEEKVKFAYQSWLFNSVGDRSSTKEINELIASNDLVSMKINFDNRNSQVLDVDVNQLLAFMGQSKSDSGVNKMSISHGVWSRVLMKESKIKSELIVNGVHLRHDFNSQVGNQEFLWLNNVPLTMEGKDLAIPYFDFDNRAKK